MKMDDGKFSVTIFPVQLKKAREFRGYKTQAACCKERNNYRQVLELAVEYKLKQLKLDLFSDQLTGNRMRSTTTCIADGLFS